MKLAALGFALTLNPMAVQQLPPAVEFTGPEVWFELYAASRGAPLAGLERRAIEGPFPDIVICYSIGALAMSILEEVRPERDYRGRCGDGDLLTVREMTNRAMALLPKSNGGK